MTKKEILLEINKLRDYYTQLTHRLRAVKAFGDYAEGYQKGMVDTAATIADRLFDLIKDIK